MDIKPLNFEEFNNTYIKKFEGDSYPLFSIVEFNLHGTCNRRCAFCPRVDESKWPDLDEELSMDLFNKIITELKEVNYGGRISFSGFSEPTLHSKLLELIKIIKRDLPDARPEIVTNGDYLKMENTKNFFDAGLYYLYVSLYTNPKNYDYFKNIQKELNLSDKRFFIRRRNLGSKNNFGLNLNNRAGAVDYSLFGKKQTNVFPIQRRCNLPMFSIFIDYNGDTLICSNDWDKKNVIGNVKNENIIKLWDKKNFHEARKRLICNDRSEKPCQKCDVNGQLSGEKFAEFWTKYYKENL